MNKPTILIVAGGKNSRFFPLNTETHKGFLSLVGKPIFVRALENLKEHGFEKIILVVSKKDFGDNGFSKYIKENDLESRLGLNIEVVLQEEALGMGNALLSAKEHLIKDINEFFILASPYHLNVGKKAQELINKKQETGASCVLSGTKTENPELFGVLDLDPNNKDKVLGITEKPKDGASPSNLKVDSIYLLDNKFINELSATSEEEYSLESAITEYSKKTNISWIENTEVTFSLKYPWHLFDAFMQIISKEKTSISKNAEISKTAIINDDNGPVIIDDTAEIGEFTKISGPCYIGKNVFVGDYSFVRGSSIEDGSIIGANAEVARSIFFEKSTIHYGYISDSILGSETQVGAGLITANKRFDRDSVKVKVKDHKIDSKREALGIITGSNAQVGIRTNTMPGILIGKNSTIYPGLTVSKNIPEDGVASSRTQVSK